MKILPLCYSQAGVYGRVTVREYPLHPIPYLHQVF